MDDLTRQENSPAGKLSNGFIRVFDGAFHSVTKSEFHRQQERQSAKFQAKAVGAHDIDDLAPIVFAQLGPDFRAESEAFLEIGLFHGRTAIVSRCLSMLISPFGHTTRKDYCRRSLFT